jgi:hypothetical protein
MENNASVRKISLINLVAALKNARSRTIHKVVPGGGDFAVK